MATKKLAFILFAVLSTAYGLPLSEGEGEKEAVVAPVEVESVKDPQGTDELVDPKLQEEHKLFLPMWSFTFGPKPPAPPPTPAPLPVQTIVMPANTQVAVNSHGQPITVSKPGTTVITSSAK